MLKYLLNLFFILTITISSTIIIGQGSASAYEEKAGVSALRLDRYDNFLENDIAEGKMAGAVSLIMRKGHVVHNETYGYNDIGMSTPMTSDKIFFIQSMTKPVVTAAFMMLYEEGHFQLKDRVSKYLPYFKNLKVAKDFNAGIDGEMEPLKREITIAHLLSHTAGLSHGLGSNKMEQDILRALYFKPHESIEGRVRALIDFPLMGHPGEQWNYSAATDVLALLIEKFSGMTPAEFLQQRIFDPLNMDDTGYNVSDENKDRVATLFTYDDEGTLIKSPQQVPIKGNKVFGGTNGLFSTAGDYMKFCSMMLNNGELNGKRFLSRKTIELMTSNHIEGLRYSAGQGFGFGFGITTDVAATKAYGSEGDYFWGGAYCTYFFIDPKEELIGVLMTQTAPYSGYYANKMRQFIYQAIVD